MSSELKKSNEEIVPVLAPVVRLALVVGTRKDIGKIDAAMTIEVRRQHFYPFYEFDMKDVVIVGLPQQYRYMTLQDMESRETPHCGYFILFLSGESSSSRPW